MDLQAVLTLPSYKPGGGGQALMTVEVSAPFTHQYYLNKLLDFIEQHSKNSNEISIKEYNNAWADYWRYYIGVNVIPAVGISKVPIKGCYWTNYQNIPISEEQHNEWKNDNAFLDGMAVIAGRVYHRKDLSDYYFAGIDADNLPAIHELFTRNGKTVSVESMSQKTILDQHDNKERLHFYVYTVGTQLRDKKSDTGKPGFDSSQLPAFEVKASSKFLNFVAPCPHETSGIRQIVGTYTPITCGYPETLEFQDHIDNICKKYGLDFGDGNGNGHAIYKIPIHDLFEDDFKVYKDHNRHEALMRVMESLMSRNVGILSEQEIQEISHKWNDKHCDPSLDAKEFERQWRCAKDFITKGNSNRNNGDKGEDSGRKKLSAKVIKTVEPQINLLFKDFTDTAFAAIGINGHKEITPVDKSKRFALWVRKVYYEQNNGATLSSDILKEVIETLKSKAIFDGQLKNLELRISKDPKDDLTYWYDLANENWEAVRITKDGWDIIPSDEVPIIFRRRSGQLAQVYPLKDYPVDILDQFLSLINVKDDENIKLILKCYIISLVIPGIAKVLLMVHSPKGAAKTAFQDLIKLLIDPSVFTSLTIPGSRRELVQQLQHNFLTFYDNLRLIPGWLSDDLCRAVTGTANSKRELYSDDDDIIYQYMRPIGFNGIPLVANKSDLLDRGLIVEVERIKNSDRRSFEYDIKPELERIKPHLLGFIFDTVVKVLIIQLKGGIKLKSVSRMADFEIACETISRCLGYEDGKFTAAYAENKNIGVSELIESSPVAKAIIELMKSNNKGSGTTTELLVVLEDVASILKISTQKDKSWPKAAHILGVRLKEIKTDLEEVGIYMHTTQNTKTKTKTLIFENRAPEEPEEPDKSDSRSNIDNVSGSPSGSFEVEAPAEAPADSPRTEHNFDSSGSPFLKERGNQGGTSDTSDINYKQQELEEETPLWVKENRGWSHIFDCNDCKLGGDTWYMQEHNCSGSMR